jgi:hypothetical protein
VPVVGEDKELTALLTLPSLSARACLASWACKKGAPYWYSSENPISIPLARSVLVETNDAQVTQLNTYNNPQTGLFKLPYGSINQRSPT